MLAQDSVEGNPALILYYEPTPSATPHGRKSKGVVKAIPALVNRVFTRKEHPMKPIRPIPPAQENSVA